MRLSKFILFACCTFFAGIWAIPFTKSPSIEEKYTNVDSAKPFITYRSEQPRFSPLGGGNFKSSGSKPRFHDDCIGCGEVGDIEIYHNAELNQANTEYTLEAQCGAGNKDLITRSPRLDKNNHPIGERCTSSYSSERGHIFWTEGRDYFFISATSLDLAEEFEKSEAFRLWKSAEDAKKR